MSMINDSSGHTTVSMEEEEKYNPPMNISSDIPLVNTLGSISSELILASTSKLTNLQIVDISSDKQYIATVDSNYILHVHKIKKNFELFEEMPVFEIYNSTDKEPVVSPSICSQPSKERVPIYKKELSPFFSDIYVCLSISDDGKFVALSVSTQEKTHTKVIIYTTDRKFQTKKGLWIIEQNILKAKESFSARPAFSNNELTLATNNGIHIFNSKFEKISTIDIAVAPETVKYRILYTSSSCNIIPDNASNSEETAKNKRERKPLDEVQSIQIEGALATFTMFIKQKILLELCESDITRIWSTENDKLIASIKIDSYNTLIALSEDNHRYYALPDINAEKILIYASKNNSKLYEIIPFKKTAKEETAPEHYMLTYLDGSFLFGDNYIFICGRFTKSVNYNFNPRNQSQDTKDLDYTFFELWDIPAQRCVYQNLLKLKPYYRRMPILFVAPITNDSFSVCFTRINNRNELESEFFEGSIRIETEKSIHEGDSTDRWKEWKSSRIFDGSENDWISNNLKNNVSYILDHPTKYWKRYMLDYENSRYVLIFGSSIVQLWRLKPIENESTTEDTNNTGYNILQVANDSNKEVLYNNFIYENELLYIHYYEKSMPTLDESTAQDTVNQSTMDDIEIEFDADGCLGRTILRRKLSENTPPAASDSSDYFYELLLPMEKIIPNMSMNNHSEEVIDSQSTDSSVLTTQVNNNTEESELKTTSQEDESGTQEDTSDESQTNNITNEEDSPNTEESELKTTSQEDESGTQEDTSDESQTNNITNEEDSPNTEESTPTGETPKKKPNGIEFHYFESTIRAVYYLESLKTPGETSYILYEMLCKIVDLLKKLFEEYEDTDYFATKSGSYSLYILAQSYPCHNFIERIILKEDKKEDKKGDKTKKMNESAAINLFGPFDNKDQLFNQNTAFNGLKVNTFIALLEQNQSLFFLFFHHVLIDSRVNGIGNMAAITDLLLHLQKEKRLDILLKCTEIMEYFPVPNNHAIEETKVQDAFNSIFSVKNQKNALTFVLPEKLRREEYGKIGKKIKSFIPDEKVMILEKATNFSKRIASVFKEESEASTYEEPLLLKDFFVSDSKILCIVPFPNFNLHKQLEKKDSSTITNIISTSKLLDSPFTKIATSRTFNNMFVESNIVIEVMTIYKWNTFAAKRFLLILFVHAVYYISFSVGVSFAEEVFGYSPSESISHAGHIVTLVLMFLSWFILCIQELRQFATNIPAYLVLYNFIDWAAMIMPIASFVLLIRNGEYLNDVTSVTTLVLWIHAILRLRAFDTFGTTLELIIQISLKTMPFIGVFCSVIFAFTHTFIVLLRQKDDSFFQEQFSGTLISTTSENNNSDQGEVNFIDTSSQNEFRNPFTAFFNVWFFIYGAWDSVNNGDAGDDTMIQILSILFSFVICLIFFNMIIALMSSTIEEVKNRGKKNWIHHLAAAVSEIELFWCTSAERLDEVNNPNLIYYVADIELYEKQEKSLKERYESYLQRYLQDRKNYPNPYESST